MNFNSEFTVHFYRPAAVIRVTGEDTQCFLQGQFTQDLNREEQSVAYGLWLTQKGKVVADSFVLRDPPSAWVVSMFCEAAVIRGRLESYIIADDVSLEDLTETWMGVTLLGAGVRAWLGRQGENLPAAGHFLRSREGLVFRGRRTLDESWEWLFPRDRLGEIEALVASVERLGADQLEILRIEAMVPAVPRDIGNRDLPNEAGLEQVAISYSKGCYLGQEVMARLKAMGQVRRRLVQVHGVGPVPLTLPAELLAGGKRMGELRSAASNGDGFVGLALVSILHLDLPEVWGIKGEEVPRVRLAARGPHA